jgi:hypothetical protein
MMWGEKRGEVENELWVQGKEGVIRMMIQREM